MCDAQATALTNIPIFRNRLVDQSPQRLRLHIVWLDGKEEVCVVSISGQTKVN